MTKLFVYIIAIQLFIYVNAYGVNSSSQQSNIIITSKNIEIDLASSQAKKAIRELIVEIRNLAPDDYAEKISEYREAFEKYAEHKKGVCSGEFSTIILDKNGLKQNKLKGKLSKEEKKFCFKELKATQINYINNMFHVRKKYLNHLHQVRLKELKEIRQIAIDQINKVVKKRKRRR